MINANELRIGNLAYNQYGKIGTVWGFKVGDATHDFEHIVSFKELNVNSCYSRYIQPIPLTPEILEKCGFAFKPTGEEVYEQIWSIDGFKIWEHDSGFCHDFHYGGDVKHLHQLQNLYFALTGEELNYTP